MTSTREVLEEMTRRLLPEVIRAECAAVMREPALLTWLKSRQQRDVLWFWRESLTPATQS